MSRLTTKFEVSTVWWGWCDGVAQTVNITGMVSCDPYMKKSVRSDRRIVVPHTLLAMPYLIDYGLIISIVIGSSKYGVVSDVVKPEEFPFEWSQLLQLVLSCCNVSMYFNPQEYNNRITYQSDILGSCQLQSTNRKSWLGSQCF